MEVQAIKNGLHYWLMERRNEAIIQMCTEQGYNLGKQFVEREWGNDKINLENICWAQIIIVNMMLNKTWSDMDRDNIFPLYQWDNDDQKRIATICNEASTFGRTAGTGVAGAATGLLFGGIVGAVIGGIGGALFGKNSADNDRQKYYEVLRKAINAYFDLIEKEMYKQINYVLR